MISTGIFSNKTVVNYDTKWRTQVIKKTPTVKGRYMLSTGEEFACEARCVTPESAEIIAARVGDPGDWIICYLENVGIVLGLIEKLTNDGFAVKLYVNEDRRTRVAARLEWHAKSAAQIVDRRSSPRIVPKHTDVEVCTTAGTKLPGEIVDISLSGAAIKLDVRKRPSVGDPVKVGSTASFVTRWTEDGFAVQFRNPFSSEGFNENIRL